MLIFEGGFTSKMMNGGYFSETGLAEKSMRVRKWSEKLASVAPQYSGFFFRIFASKMLISDGLSFLKRIFGGYFQ